MAIGNVVTFAEIRRPRDHARSAWERAKAETENDDEYAAAMRRVETAPATTLGGVLAKFEALSLYLEPMRDGAEVSEEGWEGIDRLCNGIRSALDRMTARYVA